MKKNNKVQANPKRTKYLDNVALGTEIRVIAIGKETHKRLTIERVKRGMKLGEFTDTLINAALDNGY